MKTRNGFVSNSSTSSFMIAKKYLKSKQILAIYNHKDVVINEPDAWDIEENDWAISGSTWMDNFSMRLYLQKIDIPDNVITWSDSPLMSFEEVIQVCENFEEEIEFEERVKDKAEEFIKKSALIFADNPDPFAKRMDPNRFTQCPDEIRKFVDWLSVEKPEWK